MTARTPALQGYWSNVDHVLTRKRLAQTQVKRSGTKPLILRDFLVAGAGFALGDMVSADHLEEYLPA